MRAVYQGAVSARRERAGVGDRGRARVEFGTQTAGTVGGPLPVTFTNRGGGTARPVIRLDAGPTREFAITDDRCTNTLVARGDACIVQLEFRPRGEGLRGAVLFVRDAVSNETWTVALSGSGAVAA